MPAKQTREERKAQYEQRAKFGAPKTPEQLTTANYKFVVPDYLGGLYASYGVDSTTVSVVAQLVEVGYKLNGPIWDFCREFWRDSMCDKSDAYINLTRFTELFQERPNKTKKIDRVLESSAARHVINRITNDDDKTKEMIKHISNLPSWLVFMVVDNAWKLSGTSQIAVPAFYFKEFEAQMYVSPTRYLDHPENIEEAQRRLAAGESKNRSWTVWPEHMDEYNLLKEQEAVKKARKEAQKEAEARVRYLQYGEHDLSEEEVEVEMAALQAELAALRAV